MTRVKRCGFDGIIEKHGLPRGLQPLAMTRAEESYSKVWHFCSAFYLLSHPNTASFARALCILPRVIARARAAGHEAIHEHHGCIDFCRLLAYREPDGFYAVSIAFDLRVRSLERPVLDLIL
jgi:hypothetical protein